MNWPWSSKEEPDDGAEWEEGVEEGEPEEPEPSLDDLDEEAQAIAQKLIEKQLSAERAIREKMVAGARESGIEITGDGTVAFRDPHAVASRLGMRADPHPPTDNRQPATDNPPEEPPPDPVMDAPGYAAWMRRQLKEEMKRELEESLAALKAENAELKGLVFDRETTEALAKSREAVKQHAPLIAPALDHPDFAESYAAALKGQPAANLRDPKFLAGVAGFVAAQLDPTRQPQALPPRDAKGKFTPGQVSYELSRSAVGGGLREGTASREAPEPMELTRKGRLILQEVQRYAGPITPDELEDLQHTSYEDYRQARARRKAAGRR